MSFRTIRIRERSTGVVARDDYRRVEESSQFARIIDDGVISLEKSRKAGYGIRTGPFVGQALIGDVLLQVEEKIEGSLVSLLSIAETPEARLEDASSFIESEERVLYALIDRFMAMVDRYLTYGREKAYMNRTAKGGMPRGKLLVTDTMRLWATGRHDMLAFRYQELSPRTFLNQLVGLALHVADGILVVSEASRKRRVRTAAILFEDTGWQDLLRVSRVDLDERCKGLRRDDADMASLIALARLLALHFGVSTILTNELVPFSWFVNLESLFEECVRKAISASAPRFGLKATDWRAAKRYVFADGRQYRAEPDVILWRGGRPVAVLDAKYKDLVGDGAGSRQAPDSGDIYQLIVHAQAWGIKQAALIYPAAETTYTDIGEDASGVRVGFFTVDVRRLREGATELLTDLASRPAVRTAAAADPSIS